MPLIRETIVTTADPQGRVHIAPIGIIADGDGWIIAPFRPSTTLENLQAVPFAVVNYTDDVRIFAGCLTGRPDWPTVAADKVPVPRLARTLAHAELAYKLGKRYAQDEPLDWGCGVDRSQEDLTRLREAGHTLRAKAKD